MSDFVINHSPFGKLGRCLTGEEWVALKIWRRDNPGLRLRSGNFRGDGKVFSKYCFSCKNGELWVTKEASEKAKERNRLGASKRTPGDNLRYSLASKERKRLGPKPIDLTPHARKRRYTMSAAAKAKKALWNKTWAAANKEKMVSYRRKWNTNNPGHFKTEKFLAEKSARDRRYKETHSDKVAAIQAEYRKKNSVKIRQSINRWSALNKEKLKECAFKWRQRNPGIVRAMCQRWSRANPHQVRALARRRQSRKRSLLHPDLDLAIEKSLHLLANRLEKETGIPHEVDHIIPIVRGGWHHHLNLQVLPGPINSSKHANPFWEHPNYKSWRDVPEFLWPEGLRDEYRSRMEIKEAM